LQAVENARTARHHAPAVFEHIRCTLPLNLATCLFDKQLPRKAVSRVHVLLDIAYQPTRRDIGQRQRTGSITKKPPSLPGYAANDPQEGVRVCSIGKARIDSTAIHPALRAAADGDTVQRGTLPAHRLK
jgi:hypothetical protein